MGTRSTISFGSYANDKYTDPIVTIYQQYDGYISGVGHELAEWLLKKKIINGIGVDQYTDEYANGVGCLAAQFIRDFKQKVGGLYIEEPKVREVCDYNYEVYVNEFIKVPPDGIPADDCVIIIVRNWDDETTNPLFVGKPSELLEFEEL